MMLHKILLSNQKIIRRLNSISYLSTPVDKSCWNCSSIQPLPLELFCKSCGSIQSIETQDIDYYNLSKLDKSKYLMIKKRIISNHVHKNNNNSRNYHGISVPS